MAKEKWKDELSKDEQGLVMAGAKAYGLKEGEIFAADVKDGVATIVTIGGYKVTFKDGDRVKPLHPLRAGRSIAPVAPPKE